VHGRGVGQDQPVGDALVRLRQRLERLEREAHVETVTLRCRECQGEMTVAEDTDLALLAYEWVQGSGGESYQPTPPDVFVLTEHPCGWGSLEVKATCKPWPLSDVGGGIIGLTIR
jgi:hypothetical protein